MSNQVFNPNEWSPSSLSTGEGRGEAPSRGEAASVEALVQAIEVSGIDITPSYSEWLAIAFALVSELGEDGRQYFHRISCYNPDYDYAEADHQYSVCLKDGSREITIASLFHIAKTHGVSVIASAAKQSTCTRTTRPQTSKLSSRNPREELEELEENEERPATFSQLITPQLPDILKRIVADAVSDIDADLLILGSLTVFSACLPNVYGVYDRREVFSNLFLYVTASASAGKGRLSLCRHLAAPLHRELRDKYLKSMEQFKQDQL